MAAFPDLPISYDTSIEPQQHKRVTIMKDHSFVIQKDSSDVVYSGEIRCEHLTPTDKTTLDNFYTANEDISFTFTNPHDGVGYTLLFASKIMYEREEKEATELYKAIIPVVGDPT
jgi:hypothetical protein